MFLLKIVFQFSLLCARGADTFKITQISHPRFMLSLQASGRGQKERKLLKENPVPIVAETAIVPEFSRPSTMEQLRGGRSISIEPSIDEAAGLCIRFRIIGMPFMKVNVTTQR